MYSIGLYMKIIVFFSQLACIKFLIFCVSKDFFEITFLEILFIFMSLNVLKWSQ